MYTWGMVMFFYCRFYADIKFEDWELDFFGTRVVEKRVYEKLKSECEGMPGDFKRNMDEQYQSYRMSQIK